MSSNFKIIGQLVIDDKGNLGVLDKKAEKLNKSLDKSAKSARDNDRNLKGAAQASSNTTKNFSKMAQGIEGGLVPAYATLAASLFAITAVFQGLKEAANLRNQQRGLEEFSAVTGQNMLGVAQSIRQATEGIISFKEAAQAAAITTAAGFSADQVRDLAEGAKLASVALGRDMGDSFNRLVRGVTKAEPELLDELGIILRLDIATRKFADANGLVADKLTIAQRQAAVFAEVSSQLQKNFGDFKGSADDLVNPFAQLETAFMQVIKQLSEFIGPLEIFAQFLSRNSGAAALVFAGFVTSIAKQAIPALGNLTEAFTIYGANAQARADQSVAALTRATNRFTLSAEEFNRVELRKNAVFQKYLAQRNMSDINFFRKTDGRQRNSVRMMILHMEQKAAAGAAINETELANLKLILKRMEAAHKGHNNRVVAGYQVASSAISASIVAPAALAQTGLAAMATFVATRLGPVFAAFGAIVNAAFFIFTAGFIVKFLADTIFFTEEYKKKQDELNKKFGETEQKLEHIIRVTEKTLGQAAQTGKKDFEDMNKELLRTINLLTSVAVKSAIVGTITEGGRSTGAKLGDKATGRILGTQATGVVTAGLGTDKAGTIQRLRNLVDTLGEGKFGVAGSNVRSRLSANLDDVEKGAMSVERFSQILQTSFQELGSSSQITGNMFLELLDPFLTYNDELKESVEVHTDLSKATKDLGEQLGELKRKFRPSATDTLGMGFEKVLNQSFVNGQFTPMDGESQKDAATRIISQMGADGIIDSAQFFDTVKGYGGGAVLKDIKVINMEKAKGLMTTIQEGVAATERVRGLSLETQIAKDNLSLLNSRKDATSRLAAQQAKINLFAAQQAEIENKLKIDRLEMVGLDKAAAERKQAEINKEEQKLDLIIAQRNEYQRSISAVGIINDTMEQGLEKMFMDLIQGTANFADAFRSMIKMVLIELAKLAAMKMAATTASFIGLADGGIIPMASGGVINSANRYSRGGIATEPTYLVGEGKYNEAVVPLPNGRSIPVEMNGSGATNVTINVDGASTASGGMDAETGKQLGHMIQAATMEIIQREKRPGGVLSR